MFVQELRPVDSSDEADVLTVEHWQWDWQHMCDVHWPFRVLRKSQETEKKRRWYSCSSGEFLDVLSDYSDVSMRKDSTCSEYCLSFIEAVSQRAKPCREMLAFLSGNVITLNSTVVVLLSMVCKNL
ncbi:hypothetical protein Y032_0163g3497 [Ancylostoma ceylanicum]|uniref:Uncharacterized protein n=1 Tax=Ancylostoma ceylanicum TaxID=53326 RepID=A0A016SXV6_9BILA|nr:hypothetical protein Y032_0163g3497 [Ancylostoma ceylanicum]